jgi:hypothetical protein
MATSLTREEMVEIIRRGESVLIRGFGVIARVRDLPSEAVLAAGDRDREDAALAALEAQLKAKQAELAQAREAIRRRREAQRATEPTAPLTYPQALELSRQSPQGPPLSMLEEGLPAGCSAVGPDGALAGVQVGPFAPAGADLPQGGATAAGSPPADPPPGPPVPGLVEEGLSAGADRAVPPAGPAPETPPPAGSAGRVGADQGGADRDDNLAGVVAVFAAECLDVGPGLEGPIYGTFDRWARWCVGRGLAPSTPQHFGRALRAAVPGLEEARPRTADGGRERRYIGICLKARLQPTGERGPR